MKRKIALMSLLTFLMFSWSENRVDEGLNARKSEAPIVPTLSAKQAEMYASIFSSYLDEKDTHTPDSGKTRSTQTKKKDRALAGIKSI